MHVDRRGYGYETYRQGKRVRRRYLGSGAVWGALAQVDRHDRQHATEARRAEAETLTQAQLDGAQAALEVQALCAACDALFGACMAASGYHRPKRGVWRKKRDSTDNDMAKPKTTKTQELATSGPIEVTASNKRELYERAIDGDKGAALALLAHMKGGDAEAEFLDIVAPLSQNARDAVMVVAPNNELAKAGMNRRLDLMRDELAGPKPSALELMLAERVAVCYSQVVTLQAMHANSLRESVKLHEIFGRQLDGAHRRHLDAVKALATVRKLKLPSIQVNIGENQVNMGAGGVAVVAPPVPVEEKPRGRVVDGIAH